MTTGKRMSIGIWVCIVATMVSLMACGSGDSRQTTILPDSVAIKPGDVMLRRGCGLTSRAVLMADKGGIYSHVGIAVDSAGTMMVVHAVPGEPEYKGDPDRVKMERAERFYCPVNADAGCVMRCIDSKVAAAAAKEALRLYRKGLLFDHDYDDADSTRMYCCELVEAAYRAAGCVLVTGERHYFHVPGMQFDNLILPSDFVGSARLRKVVAF